MMKREFKGCSFAVKMSSSHSTIFVHEFAFYFIYFIFLYFNNSRKLAAVSQWDWDHNSIKLGTKQVIYQKLANFI